MNAAQVTGLTVLATAVQQSVSEIWAQYVPTLMPGLAGPYTTALVGLSAAVVVNHLIAKVSNG